MRILLLAFGATLLVAAVPPPKLLSGYARDVNGMCHDKRGIYVPCEVAMPAYTYWCRDGSYSTDKILRTACKGRRGVRKVL